MFTDPLSLRLVAAALAGGLLLSSGSLLSAQTIPEGNIVVDLATFATLPDFGSNGPARVNVLRSAPDGRIFANDQWGILYTISTDGATVTPYLDLTQYIPLSANAAEEGFQSFAFHPDFNQVGTAGYGKFYTQASETISATVPTFSPGVAGANHNHDEVLLEWTVADPTAATFTPANAAQPFREVLRIARPNSNHNGGYLSFNPTAGNGSDRGNLYLGMGDSGGGGDPLGLAQMLGNAYGAILRINPLLPAAGDPQASSNGQYSVPADNPYATNAAFLPEKYAAGFRNPQRFTWDSANGHMLIADIGQNTVEEIDLGQAGANYGWNQREGSYVFNSDGTIGANVRADAATTGFTYPIAEYFHYGSIGNAVTAGPVYRGSGLPDLYGRLIFSDFVTGTPYTIDASGLSQGTEVPITQLRVRSGGVEMSFLSIIQQINPSATRADLRYGTDAEGQIYFLDKQDGVIRRIQMPAAASVHPPFFAGEVALDDGVYYLQMPDGDAFGYYSYLDDANYLYHFDLGFEYLFDAADGASGIYLYDFESSDFFYTSPSFPFPYLYDFGLNSVVYYYPDPNNPGHYNTDGVRYFYVFSTGQIISK